MFFHPWGDVLLLLILLALVSAWREPKALQEAVKSTGQLMLGMRQFSGWTVDDGDAFLQYLSKKEVGGRKGVELYERYNSFWVSFVFTAVMALQLAISLRRQGWTNKIAVELPLFFATCNLIQDALIARFIELTKNEKKEGRDSIATLCS